MKRLKRIVRKRQLESEYEFHCALAHAAHLTLKIRSLHRKIEHYENQVRKVSQEIVMKVMRNSKTLAQDSISHSGYLKLGQSVEAAKRANRYYLGLTAKLQRLKNYAKLESTLQGKLLNLVREYTPDSSAT